MCVQSSVCDRQTLSLVFLGFFKHLTAILTVWFCVQLPAVQLALSYMLCIEKRGSEKQRTEGWVVKGKRGLEEDKDEPCEQTENREGALIGQIHHTTVPSSGRLYPFFSQTYEAVRIYSVDAPVT